MSSKKNKKDSIEDDSDNESKDSLNYSSNESESDESDLSDVSDDSDVLSDDSDSNASLDGNVDQLSSDLINNNIIQNKIKDTFSSIILQGNECKSLKTLTTFEIASILGHRAQHFEGGGKCLTSVSDTDTSRMMAIKELLDGKNPLNVIRQVPDISKGIIVNEKISVSELWKETKKYVNINEFLGISINDTFK